MRKAGVADDDIHAPVDPVRAVDVEGAGCPEHRCIPVGTSSVCMAGGVVAACIGLDLGQRDLGDPPVERRTDAGTEQALRNLEHTPLEELRRLRGVGDRFDHAPVPVR